MFLYQFVNQTLHHHPLPVIAWKWSNMSMSEGIFHQLHQHWLLAACWGLFKLYS